MKRAPRKPAPMLVRVCDRCGEPFETVDPDRTVCVGGCAHPDGRGDYDPVDWDDRDDPERRSAEAGG